MTVLESGVSDVASRDTGEPRKLPGDPLGIRAGLLDPQPRVLALAAKLGTQLFDYLEIVKDGRVAHEVRLQDYAQAGGKLPTVTFQNSGWMLIRAVARNPKTFRFASTGPYYVEIGGQPRVSKTSAQFFLDWVDERVARIKLEDAQQRDDVLQHHRAARQYWQRLVENANAE